MGFRYVGTYLFIKLLSCRNDAVINVKTYEVYRCPCLGKKTELIN